MSNTPMSSWRPAVAYLTTLSVLAAVIFFFIPFALIALAPIFVVVIAIVWARAGFRTRRWFWINPRPVLTEVERSVWTSALLIIAFGIAAAAFTVQLSNAGHSISFRVPWLDTSPRLPSRSMNYHNPESQKRFIEALEVAKVPYKLTPRDGKEWISWEEEHNESVEKIRNRADGFAAPPKRSVSFSDPTVEHAFVAWLTQQGIPHKVLDLQGTSYVVWEGDHASQDLVHQYMESRGAECNRKNEKKSPAKKRRAC